MRIVIAVFALLSAQALADERVSPTLDLSAVRVEVTWVADRYELARIRTRFEGPRDIRAATSIDARDVGGFFVLGKRNGEPVCLLFVFKPVNIDDGATTALGHEVLHCLLGSYHQ
jgi:hypothetical protein